MMGPRDIVKAAAWTIHSLRTSRDIRGAVSILAYHRVTGDMPLELDLPFDTFKRQLHWLAETGNVISLCNALTHLASGSPASAMQYVLTFDDAYSDFFDRAYPLLCDLQLPATLFVPTNFIDVPAALPLSRHIADPARFRPMTWDQIREVDGNSLFEIGCHSHNHRDYTTLSDAEIAYDIMLSLKRFREEIRYVPKRFAYPRGDWNERVDRVVSKTFRVSATIDGGLAHVGSDVKRISRVPIKRSDGWRWFQARVDGYLDLEHKITVRARKRLLT